MRDDRDRWPATGQFAWPLALDGAELAPAPVARQTLMSGQHVLKDCAHDLVRWPDRVPEGTYALALRRDSVLVVDGPEVTDGWDGGSGRAISDVSDAYTVFDLSGPRALEILRHGAEISDDLPSGGAGRILFGIPVLMSRGPGSAGLRLHVRACDVAAFVAHLIQTAETAGGRMSAPRQSD